MPQRLDTRPTGPAKKGSAVRNVVRLLAACALLTNWAGAAAHFEGTGQTDFHGYTQCVKSKNDQCRIILGHDGGGRVSVHAGLLPPWGDWT